jgi:single-stranded DNA-specific DHH superfamily exonuclease
MKMELKDLKGKCLLIHHWDTDGICSARLILSALPDKDITNKTPELGNYYLTDEELERYSKYDFVIIVDMNLPENNVLKLAENAEVFIFDHHLGKVIDKVYHHNPVIKGKNPDKYPSASWIVNDFLGNDVNLFALLGIAGDHEQKIKNNEEFFKKITDFCQENYIDFNKFLKMVYILDSNYKSGNKEAVEEAPRLLPMDRPIDFIFNNKTWNDNLEKLDNEIKVILETPADEVNGIILKRINTNYNIISTITRKVAWESGKNTIVVNTGFFDDKDQIYMRSIKNAEPMILRGKSLGFKCGGKKEVLGAIVPKDKTESFVQEMLDFLIK